jgi:hypothetical protein
MPTLDGNYLNNGRYTMNTKVIKASLIAASIIAGTSAVKADVFDKKLTMSNLKIAVVKGALGSKEILSGEYSAGLDKISSESKLALQDYDKAMGVCVASLKLRNYDQAKSACTKAIVAVNDLNGTSTQEKFLKSIAYSNRGIVRYLSNDSYGALSDFTTALLVDRNAIVKGNLIAIKSLNSTKGENTLEASLAD